MSFSLASEYWMQRSTYSKDLSLLLYIVMIHFYVFSTFLFLSTAHFKVPGTVEVLSKYFLNVVIPAL